MADLEIKYNNFTIATRSATGITTLNTAGKFCADSIQINYYGTLWAKINVTYPSGSTCTATNGTITLTASDTSGSYLFEIPEPSSKPETWTISCTDGIDSTSKTVSISTKWQIENIQLKYISDILNEVSWQKISQVAQAGIGDTYWDLGDAKEITFKNGAIIGRESVSNVTLCVFILSFNHVDNGVADNNILFGGFKSALLNGKDTVLVDSFYGDNVSDSTDTGRVYNLFHCTGNTGNTNGGWKGCDFRYDILGSTKTPPLNYRSTPTDNNVGYDATLDAINDPMSNTLMSAIPDDFRAVLRLRTHYTNNRAHKNKSVAEDITSVVDSVSIMSVYEIMGTQGYGNSYETSVQSQVGYYSVGNSRIRYKYNSLETAAHWLTLSPLAAYATSTANGETSFNVIAVDGNYIVGGTDTRMSSGIAPVFKV